MLHNYQEPLPFWIFILLPIITFFVLWSHSLFPVLSICQLLWFLFYNLCPPPKKNLLPFFGNVKVERVLPFTLFIPSWHKEFSMYIHMYVHEYVPAQQLCFSNCIVKEIETVLIQGIVIATIVYVNLCGAIKIYIVLLRKLTCEKELIKLKWWLSDIVLKTIWNFPFWF